MEQAGEMGMIKDKTGAPLLTLESIHNREELKRGR